MVKGKKMGIGTVSLVLVGVGIAWGIQWNDGNRVAGLGVSFLRAMGFERLVVWNPNIPYLFSYAFTIPAFLIGRKYNEHFGANAGRVLAILYGIVCLLAVPWPYVFK